MKLRLSLFAAAILLSGSLSASALTSQDIVNDLGAQGYTRIEVKVGPTQTKVEAIRGTEKIEVVYDNATGATLKSETGTVRPGEDTAPGVEIKNRKHDFVGSDDDGGDDDVADDEGDDNSGSDDGDDNEGSDDHGDHDGDGGDHEGHGGGNSGEGGDHD